MNILARLLFSLFCLFSSLFAILAYVPFTYEQIHKAGLIPALTRFGPAHPYFAAAATLLLVYIFRRERLYWPQVACAGAVVGVFCFTSPAFAHLENNTRSLTLALLSLAPVLLLAALEAWEARGKFVWSEQAALDDRRLFRAAWSSALFVTVVYSAIAFWRAGMSLAVLPLIPYVTAAHLVGFLFLLGVLNLVTVLSSWFDRPSRAQFVLVHLVVAGGLFFALKVIVLPAMGWSGSAALAFCGLFSLAVSACFFACALRRTRPGPVASGLSMAFWYDPVPGRSTGFWWILGAACLAALAAWLASESSRMDWNFLLQKLSVLLVWLLSFRFFYGHACRLPQLSGWTFRTLIATIAVLFAYRTLDASQALLAVNPKALDQHADFNVSYRILRSALTPERRDPGFFRFLADNTNIPRSVRIDPASVDFVDSLSESPSGKPNIFIVVIDSLRRDYLQPYNSGVTFTPEIARFASESVVLDRAFTRYGGTGLSEPSIWVGGMLVHKQYVTPFAPMNALRKLLEAERYHSFVSRDSILQTVVEGYSGMTELDHDKGTMDYDLCESLSELESKIDSGAAAGRPMFAYTQPQNIHISVINRQGAKSIDGLSYPGFYAPYASRLRRMDSCFGKFVGFLKRKNIYDSSIVILTADHGDSLGEQGRWGHAYTIYPEILRIPLILHVPESVRRGLDANTREVAFSTDITPTLYYLLGHKPKPLGEMFGKPLFTEKPEERVVFESKHYMVASSYAAVYGLISRNGNDLFVADAVNQKEMFFDLTSDSPSESSVSRSDSALYENHLRDKILALNKFFRYTPPAR